jgi:hypothetical protein
VADSCAKWRRLALSTVAAIERKHAPRRKAAALVVSGAVAASPVLPQLAARRKGSGAANGERGETRAGSVVRLPSDALVELGDVGRPGASSGSAVGRSSRSYEYRSHC